MCCVPPVMHIPALCLPGTGTTRLHRTERGVLKQINRDRYIGSAQWFGCIARQRKVFRRVPFQRSDYHHGEAGLRIMHRHIIRWCFQWRLLSAGPWLCGDCGSLLVRGNRLNCIRKEAMWKTINILVQAREDWDHISKTALSSTFVGHKSFAAKTHGIKKLKAIKINHKLCTLSKDIN